MRLYPASHLREVFASRGRDGVLNHACSGSSGKKRKVSGAGARLCAAIESERSKCDGEPLVIFTGNSFGSSFEGTVTKGDHLVPTLNALGVYSGGVGPSDFDHGVQNLERIAASLNFPLLLSNVVEARTGAQISGTQASRVVHWAGRRIGIMAVAAEETLATTGTVEIVTGTGFSTGKGSRCVEINHRSGGSPPNFRTL